MERERHRTAADLSAYVDGELGPWRRWRIHRHLQGCEPCRRFVEQLAGIVGALRARGTAEPLSPHLHGELRQAYAQWASSRPRP